MKAVKLPLIDFNAMIAKIEMDIIKMAKKVNAHFDEMIITQDTKTPGVYVISFENNMQLAEHIALMLDKHKWIKILAQNDYPGYFDWKADTYIKDCSVVTIHITQTK